jgi:hypothetical protein
MNKLSKWSTQMLRLALLTVCLFARPARSAVLTGPITNGTSGNIYYLLSQNSWPASEAEAIELGGHLATIDDQAENDWVFSTFAAFGGQPRCLWIGFRRQQIHGDFSWADGSSSTFTNWSTGEPNDHFYGGEPEYFAFMWDPSRTEFFRMPGTWNDVPDINAMDTVPIHGVVEITRPRMMIRREPNGVQVGWTSRTNKVYQLEHRTSLAPSNSWTPLGAATPGNGSTNWVLDLNSGQTEKYYRIFEAP